VKFSLLAALAVSGCQCLGVPDVFRCDDGGACPSGYECTAEGWCLSGSDDGGGTLADSQCLGRWCWDHPTPMGQVQLNDLVELAPNDIWFCGNRGNLFHYDGTRFVHYPIAQQGDLHDLWASGPNDVWVAGRHQVLHWDGTSLTEQPYGPTNLNITTVGGRGPNDVWAFAESGQIFHFNGSWLTWNAPMVGNLYASKFFPGGQALAAGDGLLQLSGTQWTAMPVPVPQTIYSLSGVGIDDVWMAGNGGTLLHHSGGDFSDAGAWSRPLDAGSGPILSVFELDSSRLFYGQGGVWEATPATIVGRPYSVSRAITAIEGLGVGDIWAVGDNVLVHRPADNAQFQDLTADNNDLRETVFGAAVSPAGEVWVVGQYQSVHQRVDGGWVPVPVSMQSNMSDFYRAYSPARGQLIVVGEYPGNAMVLQNGTMVPLSGVTTHEQLHGVFGFGPDDIWLTGHNGYIGHFIDGGWNETVIPGAIDFNAVWGAAPDDVWVAGTSGHILHYVDGGVISETMTLARTINTITGLDRDRVFFGDVTGDVYMHPTSGPWVMDIATNDAINDLIAYKGKIYAVGAGANSWVRSGGAWSALVVPTLDWVDLRGLGASPRTGVFAVGDDGTILHLR
jgi:hypothetical protein